MEKKQLRSISDRDRVNKETLDVYENIDGFEVIKELLLHKGEDICKDMRVNIKYLEQMALIVYGLKVNPTNKLYVGYALDRFYRRKDLVTPGGRIKVPVQIFDEVKALNDKYRKG